MFYQQETITYTENNGHSAVLIFSMDRNITIAFLLSLITQHPASVKNSLSTILNTHTPCLEVYGRWIIYTSSIRWGFDTFKLTTLAAVTRHLAKRDISNIYTIRQAYKREYGQENLQKGPTQHSCVANAILETQQLARVGST